MIPGADKLSVFKKENNISIANCRKTVCNNDRRTSFHKDMESILHESFCGGIQRTRCLIKDENLRIGDDGSCDCESLFFTPGEFESPLPYFRLKSLLKPLDKLENIRIATRFTDSLK